MKPVEEIARLERIEKALGAARSTRDWHGMEVAYNELRDHALPAIAAALRAEREISDKSVADYESAVRSYARELANANARAEKAEAERDEVLWDARYQIDAQVKSREAAESALATARNRALEEAAECVKDCRQWEPECPHAARILSLRIPEAST